MITIVRGEQEYIVTFTDGRGRTNEVAFGDKDTSMEDHAQGFVELCGFLNVECQILKGH